MVVNIVGDRHLVMYDALWTRGGFVCLMRRNTSPFMHISLVCMRLVNVCSERGTSALLSVVEVLCSI